MSNANDTAPARPPLISGDILGNIPQLVYLLYFIGFVFHPAALVGVVLAFVNRNEGTPVERSHYEFQISTFWRGFVMLAASLILAFFVVGWLLLVFWMIWTIVRSAKGLSNLSRGQPMREDIGWGFG
ncbi:MAG: hypothetical protein JSR47_14400 [Proteobacteria bacterium]|nr:hypothetical protein [Pseudomonadota bacterium]